MNPVDYFDPAKDTIRRVLGTPVLPRIETWKRVPNASYDDARSTDAPGYVLQYGERRYEIFHHPGANAYAVSVSYSGGPRIWIGDGAKEFPKPLDQIPVVNGVLMLHLTQAVRLANEHAYSRP